MTQKIRQAVVPMAGLGSRFLPVTKTVPKELLPLVDKPCLQHIVEEGLAAGVEEFIFVLSPEKQALANYFKPSEHLDKWLLKRGQKDLYEGLKRVESLATFRFVQQEEPLGLGHAVLCAQELVRDEYFFVILPDDITDAEVPVCRQLWDVFASENKPVVAVMPVTWEEVHRYGIVQAQPMSERAGAIEKIIEKPRREDAPSNLAVIGRYLLPRDIFTTLAKITPGAGGEIQLTDALQELIKTRSIISYAFEGERYDTGYPLGLLQASISLALKNPKLQGDLARFIKTLAAGL